ncbi:MAG: ribonuclease HI family protein [Armatimonadetes bacterium]|nr:ribonuclease HI family protein [Armatimonadota bacterium]
MAALADTLDLKGVLARFRITPEQLRQLLREAATALGRGEAETWRLYVDGASRGNPGPAGAGAVLLDAAGQVVEEGSRFLGRATNNVAEYQALLLGLELARRHGVKSLDIFADSELLVRQLTGRYQVRSPHLKLLFQAVRQALAEIPAWRLTHLPRRHNAAADRLANAAIDREALRR